MQAKRKSKSLLAIENQRHFPTFAKTRNEQYQGKQNLIFDCNGERNGRNRVPTPIHIQTQHKRSKTHAFNQPKTQHSPPKSDAWTVHVMGKIQKNGTCMERMMKRDTYPIQSLKFLHSDEQGSFHNEEEERRVQEEEVWVVRMREKREENLISTT